MVVDIKQHYKKILVLGYQQRVTGISGNDWNTRNHVPLECWYHAWIAELNLDDDKHVISLQYLSKEQGSATLNN